MRHLHILVGAGLLAALAMPARSAVVVEVGGFEGYTPGTLNGQNGWVNALMVFMALNSVLSLGYYAPLVNMLYRKQPSPQVLAGKPVTWTISLALLLLSVFVIVLGFAPGLMDWFTVPAAERLLEMFGY